MFKLPSVTLLYKKGRETLFRFPLVLLCAAVCATLSIIMAHQPDAHKAMLAYLLPLTMGIPLFFAVHLNLEIESSNQSFLRKFWPLFIGGAFVVYLFFTYNEDLSSLFLFRYFQLNFGMHLLVAFTPFLFAGKTNGFWQFNKTLFLRFLLSYIYVTTLYIGLAIALWAVSYLLAVKVDSHLYGDLYIFLVFVFNTWFFLAGLPEDVKALDESTEYPSGLKIFTQYILIPLVTLYLAILYLYMGKIIMKQEWPKGTIGYLVSGVSILGILNLLLIYPFQFMSGNRWIKAYSKGFYGTLFPLIVLLGMGTWQRVTEYGITEKRYLLIVIALWITAMAFYFTLSRIKNIKVIPVTLAFLAFATSVGPWSAYQVSKYSQLSRLKQILELNKLLENGKIITATVPINFEASKQISSIVEYFHTMQGYEAIEPLFPRPIFGLSPSQVTQSIGISFVNRWQTSQNGENKYFSYQVNLASATVMPIAGYDYLCEFPWHSYGSWPEYVIGGRKVRISYGQQPPVLEIYEGSKLLITSPMDSLLKNAPALAYPSSNYPGDKLTLTAENDEVKMLAQITNMSGTHEIEGDKLSSLTGRIFLKFKR